MGEPLTKNDIIHSIVSSKNRLCSFGVRTIGLFGSFVRDEATTESDVDILVEFESGQKNYDNFIETCFLLEDILNRKVELVTADSISPYIKPYVLKEIEYVPIN